MFHDSMWRFVMAASCCGIIAASTGCPTKRVLCASDEECQEKFGPGYVCNLGLEPSVEASICFSPDDLMSPCGDSCMNPTPICEVATRECRDCNSGECSGTTPICLADLCMECFDTSSCVIEGKCTEGDPGCVCRSDGACGACTRHEDCDSAICADGTCVEEADVAYVAMNGNTDPACGIGGNLPCAKINDALMRGTPWVRIAKGAYTTEMVNINRAVNIVGEYNDDGSIGVMITPMAGGQRILSVTGQQTMVSVEGVALRAVSSGGISIACEVSASLHIERVEISGNSAGTTGLFAIDGCAVVMEQSRVGSNSSVGIQFDGALFQLRNNIIVRNSTVGLSAFNIQAQSLFEFNTVVDNGTGMVCNNGLLVASHNIIWSTEADLRDCPEAMADDFSLIKSRDAEEIPDLLLDSSYHLTAESPAIDMGSSAALEVTDDFDGQPRPSGTAADIGADEYYPR